jgi:thiol-disulfide isomerase/thioredoxin
MGRLGKAAISFLGLMGVSALGCATTGTPTEAGTATANPALEQPAVPTPVARPVVPPTPELSGISAWLNSEPLTIAELSARGRVVLIDFWTYTCVNCIRTLPFLRLWDQRYRDHGLSIIGVHTPEFEFEKDAGNVRMAVESLGLAYPIAQDNEKATWRAFGNQVWPAKYLIVPNGDIPYRHFGEGDYELTEHHIRLALEAAGRDLSAVAHGGYQEPALDPDAVLVTAELYGGYERNYRARGEYAGQDLYYRGPDMTALYEDEREHRLNRWYAHGLWRNEAQAIVHARETSDLEDYIALRMTGRTANVVISPARPVDFEVFVEIDGRPLNRDEAGADIQFDVAGRSVVLVQGARMYQVIDLPVFGIRELKLRSNSDAFAVYSFTFGGYQDGP